MRKSPTIVLSRNERVLVGRRRKIINRRKTKMPSSKVMPKYKRGELRSGSKKGPKVKNRKQAIAIMLSEKRKEEQGKKP